MNKIDLGQAIAILANVGVIVGIAFPAVEIGQNTRSLEVGAYQDLIGQIARLNELALEDAAPFALVEQNRDLSLNELEPEQYEQVVAIALLVFRHGDMAFFQVERGLISNERLESVLGPVRNSACTPVYQEVWSLFGENYVDSYRSYVDSRIASC